MDQKTEILKAEIEQNSKYILSIYGEDKYKQMVEKELESELNYEVKIKDLISKDIPMDIINEYKKFASENFKLYSKQYAYVDNKIFNYEKNKKIESLKHLFVTIENLIGGQCYNGNIQNYSSWGEWEGEGREFKYPIKYRNINGAISKIKYMNEDLDADQILSSYYPFGANELHIGKAIFKLIELLEESYGLDFEQLEAEKAKKNKP